MGRDKDMIRPGQANNFEQLFDEAPLPYQSLDEKGIILKVNKAWLDALGYEKEEVIGKWFGDFLALEFQEHFKENFPKFKEVGKAKNVELKMVRKDEKIIDISYNCQVGYDGDGKFLRTHCVFDDITERRKAEEEWVIEKEKAETYLKIAGVMIITINSEGIVTMINQKGCDILGYDKSEIVGKNWFDNFLPERLREEVLGVSHQILEGDLEPVRTYVNPVLRKDGIERIILWEATYVHDDAGKITGHLSSGMDITERKEAEEALIESEEKYRLLANNAIETIWVMDPQGKFTYHSPSVMKLRGYTPEEANNISLEDTMVPESMPLVKRIFEEENSKPMAERWAEQTIELNMYRKDGSVISIEASLKGIRDTKGNISAIQGRTIDITERKKAEKALKEGDRLFKLITENMEDEVWLMDMDLNVTFMTQSVLRDRGYSLEDMQKMDWADHLTPESLEVALGGLELALTPENLSQKDKDVAGTLDLEFYHKDGHTVWADTTIKLLRDENGEPIGLLGVAHDITERKKAEESLIDSENRLNIIFESAPDAYYLNDFEGTFMDGNKAAEELLGYSREELIGKDFADAGILPMEQVEKALNLLAENINGKTTGPDEFTLKRKDGSKVDVEILTHPVKIGGKDRILGIAREITERKKAEEALENSEERFNQVAKHSMEWIWEIDAEGKFTYASQMCEEVYGYKPDELIGKYFYELAAPEIREKIKDSSFKEIIKNKKSFRNTLNRCIRKDGKYIWIKSSGFPTLDEKGNVIGYRGSDIDVSEQIRIEEAIDESEEKFRAVFNEALDGIVLINADNGMIIDANPEFQRISGRSISQLRALHIWDIRPEDMILLAKDTFKNIKNIDDHLRIIETQFMQPSGDIVPVEFKAHKVVIRNNEYILTIARDMTQIVQAKEDIKSSEEKFQNLFEESLDAVYITDKDGTVIDMNLAGCNMLGYSRDEMVGENAVNTYFQEEDRLRLQQEIREKGSVQDFEVVLKRKDGSQIFCLISATSKKDSKGKITSYQGIIHDLTDRIIIEQRYRDEFERAEFYNDLMSHDVRNYNQGIMSNLELMNMSEDLSESAKRFSRNALNQVIGSSRLINNLQTLSDLKHSKASLDDMDIIPFIGEALDYTKTSFTDKTLKVNFPDEGKSIIVKGNSMLLEVFNNLLTNAVKFDRNQEVHIEINISEDEKFYKFEFKDHGPGIEDNMKSRVFDRNIRTDEGIWGTGLGLTLVKQIVDTIGGDIWVEDRIEGKRTEGSNFILTLPRGDAHG